jgi:hypothetical protein
MQEAGPGRRASSSGLWWSEGRGYDPPLSYKRTPAERVDPVLAWRRRDKAFFAAGACHILAWAFLDTFPAAGFFPVGVRRIGRPHAGHAYVSDGTWAFDHDGWTLEAELLTVTRRAHARSDPDIGIERLVLGLGLQAFCSAHNCADPSQFAVDPRPRALRYLARFARPDQVLGT